MTSPRDYSLDEVITAVLLFAANHVACGIDELPLDDHEESVSRCVEAFENSLRKHLRLLKEDRT
jgi:hypothetical protein